MQRVDFLFLKDRYSRTCTLHIESASLACLVANASSTLRKILNEMNEIRNSSRFDFKFHEKWKARELRRTSQPAQRPVVPRRGIEGWVGKRRARGGLGADLAFATVDELLEAQLKRDWKPHADGAENNTTRSGVDYVFEATNDAEGLNDAARACAIGASIVAIGIPDGGAYAPADAAELRRKAITTRWSRRMGDVMLEAIALVERGAIDVESLVTHRVALGEDVAHAFARAEAYEEGCIKTVVDITTS